MWYKSGTILLYFIPEEEEESEAEEIVDKTKNQVKSIEHIEPVRENNLGPEPVREDRLETKHVTGSNAEPDNNSENEDFEPGSEEVNNKAISESAIKVDSDKIHEAIGETNAKIEQVIPNEQTEEIIEKNSEAKSDVEGNTYILGLTMG